MLGDREFMSPRWPLRPADEQVPLAVKVPSYSLHAVTIASLQLR